MPQTFIHIGYHKSASTHLQTIFPQLPVNYLFFAGHNRELLKRVEDPHTFDAAALRALVADEIQETRGGYHFDTTVLSHEALSGHPHGYPSVFSDCIARNLKELYPQAKILIIIRNQLDYISSLYAFRVAIKGYESRSLERFIQEEGELGLLAHLEYAKLIELYQDLFGKERVLVLPMEMLKSHSEQFFERLFAFMGLDKPSFRNPKRSNESTRNLQLINFWRPINYVFGLSLAALRMVMKSAWGTRLIDKYRFSYYEKRAEVTRAINKRSKVNKSLDISTLPDYPALVERFGKTNQQLEAKLGLPLSSYGYPATGKI